MGREKVIKGKQDEGQGENKVDEIFRIKPTLMFNYTIKNCSG